MTESEVIEELKYDCNELGKAIPCDTSWGKSFENAYAMAIKALEEVQQYREIGTPEECRAAMEKQPVFNMDKVVEQLKAEKEFSYADFDEYVNEVCPCLDAEYDDLFYKGLERAIDIVKAGGVDGN